MPPYNYSKRKNAFPFDDSRADPAANPKIKAWIMRATLGLIWLMCLILFIVCAAAAFQKAGS